MTRRILVRVGVGLVTLWAVSTIVFLGTEALPGDAATAALGQQATPELLAQYREDFGLDRPVLERYWDWFSGFVRGDLGISLPSGEPVWGLVEDKARNTLALSLATLILLVPISLVLGIYSAVRRDGWFDSGVTGSTLTLIATPEFVVGTILIAIFAVWLGVLPAVSLVDAQQPILGQLDALVLPVLTLLAASMAQTIRMVRACMIDTLRSDYVAMARLKGVPERRVLFHHALPNALAPTIQVVAINIAWLVGGIIVVEAVFQYPGLGLELSSAVSRRDLGIVVSVATLITAVYIVVNLLADVTVMLLNPRLRRGAG